jgi:hypothetical protein
VLHMACTFRVDHAATFQKHTSERGERCANSGMNKQARRQQQEPSK